MIICITDIHGRVPPGPRWYRGGPDIWVRALAARIDVPVVVFDPNLHAKQER